MSRIKRKRNFIGVIVAVIIAVMGIALICGLIGGNLSENIQSAGEAVGGIIPSINGGSSTSSVISVTCSGDSDVSELSLPLVGQADFEVDGNSEYTVSIVPNVTIEDNFGFYVDGKAYSYLHMSDLTDAFSISITENGFQINCDQCDYSVVGVLSYYYPETEIEVTANTVEYPYRLIVTGTENAISILLKVSDGGIELSNENIIF